MIKRKKLPKILVLVEGENEKSYWSAMRYLGKARKLNLWQATDANLDSLLLTVKGDEQIIVIADTDQLKEINTFVHNITRIKNHCTLVPLIILQHKNFEDELCYSCTCNINDLYKHFDATGLKNFKANINEKGKRKQLAKKLDDINHQKSLMWFRSIQNMPPVFSNIRELIGNYDTLVGKNVIVNQLLLKL